MNDAPGREAQVPSQHKLLDKSLAELEAAFTRLTDRISTVLTPVTPRPVGVEGGPISSPQVPLAETLRKVVERVRVLADQVNEIYQRVEL